VQKLCLIKGNGHALLDLPAYPAIGGSMDHWSHKQTEGNRDVQLTGSNSLFNILFTCLNH